MNTKLFCFVQKKMHGHSRPEPSYIAALKEFCPNLTCRWRRSSGFARGSPAPPTVAAGGSVSVPHPQGEEVEQ